MRIVFMGTPDFAVPTLEALFNSNHEIVGVYCQPDKPVGRKQILTAPPVKEFAVSKNLKVFQPVSLRNEEVFNELKNLSPDLIVVVAYGKILPENILKLPKFGCINGHASLLPKYRGASPIQWAIVCGEKVTGVTTMFMDVGLDTGDILETVQTEIYDNETGEELFNRLSILTAELMLSTVEKAENGQLCPVKQNEELASYAPIIKKEMGLLDFNKDAQTLKNLIRGFNSWPVAYTFFNGKRLKVFSADIGEQTQATPSTVIKSDNTLQIACGNNTSLIFKEVQLEGSKKMKVSDMLKGNAIEVGVMLGGE